MCLRMCSFGESKASELREKNGILVWKHRRILLSGESVKNTRL
jgi:hypothetical protein